MSIYRPPVSSNLDHFFDNLISSLNKASKTYENFLLMGDFNIDVKKKGTGYKKLDEFCITFGFKSIVNRETCFKGNQ